MAPRKSTDNRAAGVTSKTKIGRRSKPVKAARAKAISASTRADLLFSIPKVAKLMRRDRLAATVGRRPAVVMAAVMEYIASEVLELAGNVCQEAHKKQLRPRHIMLAVANDEELSKVISGAIFHESGVAPHVEPSLFPAKKSKKGASPRKSSGGT